MVKRHEALQPLSRHHHHALVAALKLKRAGTEKSKFTTEEVKTDLQLFWNPGGKNHFREEEEILLPAYAKYTALDHPEISEMLLEHVKIRSLISEVDKVEGDPIALMHELGHLLEEHVRKEEGTIFPMIEEALPKQALVDLAPCFHTHYKS